MTEMITSNIKLALGIEPLSLKPLSGGCVGEVYKVELPADNPFNVFEVVVKTDSSMSAKLDIEGYMLKYLGQTGVIPVPKVYYSSTNLLVMEWIKGASRFTPGSESHAAELIAELHGIKADKFGLEKDTLIGGLYQPNLQSDSWVEFFRDQRIMHMAKKAFEEKNLPLSSLKRIERFCDRIDNWISEPLYPSLLHGDMWTTNILAKNNRIKGFIDPAIYYGHPEIELAFTTLFGTFGESFFKRYEEIRPIEPGFFEIRKELYNLYPLLVHVRLFGSGYLASIERVLKKSGC